MFESVQPESNDESGNEHYFENRMYSMYSEVREVEYYQGCIMNQLVLMVDIVFVFIFEQ